MLKAAYWIFNYEPKWEAVSAELDCLAEHANDEFDIHIYSFNKRSVRISMHGRNKAFPLPCAVAFLPFLRKTASRYNVNHIFASAAEPLLTPKLASGASILTVSKGTGSLSSIEKNFEHLRKFAFVVVESDRDKQIMEQAGVAATSIRLIRPGFEIAPYVPARVPFRLLFASSPFGKHQLLGRGIYLMLEAAQRMPDVEFLIVWRESYAQKLVSLVQERQLSNVKVHNGYVPNMGEVYDSVHGSIIPALDYCSVKPCPHSAVESLAHGKPIVTSSISSLASIVCRRECGVCCEPNTEDLVAAIERLRNDYDRLQANCHEVVRDMFSPEYFRREYMSLYRAMTESSSGGATPV